MTPMPALERLKKIVEGMTAGPWDPALYPEMTRDQIKAWLCDCIDKGMDGFSLIQSRLPKVDDDGEHPTVATTGNGPTSAANALGIAALRNCAEEMLAVCEAAKAEIDRVERYKVATSDNEKMAISKESADHYFDVREALAALEKKLEGV